MKKIDGFCYATDSNVINSLGPSLRVSTEENNASIYNLEFHFFIWTFKLCNFTYRKEGVGIVTFIECPPLVSYQFCIWYGSRSIGTNSSNASVCRAQKSVTAQSTAIIRNNLTSFITNSSNIVNLTVVYL